MRLTDDQLEWLFDENAGELLRWFGRRVMDAQAAIDLTSETFAQALVSRESFEGTTLDETQPWLYGIARNLLRHYYRSGRAEREAMEKLRMERVELWSEDIAEIEELADLAALRSELERHMDRLPADQRAAVHQRIVLGLDYSQISLNLGVTETTLRAQVSRGLRALREWIESESDTEGGES